MQFRHVAQQRAPLHIVHQMNFSNGDEGVDDDRWANSGDGRIDRNNDSLSAEDDDPFWTREQLMVIKHLPPNAFLIMGLIVSVIGLVGLVANGTVLFIFSR